jgi:hypothetical protein
MAEGVGFEPTVGFPTLDFESSALNRTQPPFRDAERKRRTPNVEHPISNATIFEIRRWALDVEGFVFRKSAWSTAPSAKTWPSSSQPQRASD